MLTSMRISGLLAAACMAATAVAGPFDGWTPHAYCNDLDQITGSKIVPLTAEQEARVESLEQVQLVARHGGRAPYAKVFCWDKAHHNPVGAKWTCGPSSVTSQNVGYQSAAGYGRLYSKVYMDGGNTLRGTCIVGGLLPLGRQQHLINGQYLRDAYIGDGALKLFADDDLKDAPAGSIYLRSDDQERTVGSGHALVDGLFPPDDGSNANLDAMLTWHTFDYAMDYIGGNDRICPMMGVIGNESNESPEFKKHLSDPVRIKLEKDFTKLVGNFSWDTILECLSVARCNDLELPPGVDNDMFTNVFHEVEVRQGIFLTHNDSWYAKVAMQPLMAEIVTKLDAVVNGSSNAPRLVITMAHDSTVMPLLAAIQRDEWDRKWTPYAGMMVIEVYKMKAGSHAARLLFQGQPLKIPECADTLCDIKDFFKALEFGRTPRACDAPTDKLSLATSSGSFTFAQYLSIFALLSLVGLCAFLGLRSYREERMRHFGGGDERGGLLG